MNVHLETNTPVSETPLSLYAIETPGQDPNIPRHCAQELFSLCILAVAGEMSAIDGVTTTLQAHGGQHKRGKTASRRPWLSKSSPRTWPATSMTLSLFLSRPLRTTTSYGSPSPSPSSLRKKRQKSRFQSQTSADVADGAPEVGVCLGEEMGRAICEIATEGSRLGIMDASDCHFFCCLVIAARWDAAHFPPEPFPSFCFVLFALPLSFLFWVLGLSLAVRTGCCACVV
jgi:hypothetical protein